MNASTEPSGEPEPWSTRSRRTLIETPWLKIARDEYVQPNGDPGEYTYVDIPGSTMVVPVLDDGRLVMVEQFRYLFGRTCLEFPAGGLKVGYDPLDGAKEELAEESGYEAGSWIELGRFSPYNGVSNEYCHVYEACDLVAVGARPEPTESFRVVEIAPDALRERIRSNEIWDGMTITSFMMWSERSEGATRE